MQEHDQEINKHKQMLENTLSESTAATKALEKQLQDDLVNADIKTLEMKRMDEEIFELRETFKKKMNSMEQENSQLRSQLQHLQVRLKEKEERLLQDHKNDEEKFLQERNLREKLEKELQVANNSIDNLHNEYLRKEQQLDEQNVYGKELENQKRNYESELITITSIKTALELEIKQLKEKITELESSYTRQDDQTSQLEILAGENEHSKTKDTKNKKRKRESSESESRPKTKTVDEIKRALTKAGKDRFLPTYKAARIVYVNLYNKHMPDKIT